MKNEDKNSEVQSGHITPRQALLYAALTGWKGDEPNPWFCPVAINDLLAWAESHGPNSVGSLQQALEELVLEGLFFEIHRGLFDPPCYYCSFQSRFLGELPDGPAFTGMRIGELKQLTWEDVDLDHNVIHVHRGGSGGKPKDKEDRFIPVHARKLGPVLRTLPRASEQVVLMPDGKVICEKKLRAYLKGLCRQCGLPNPQQYKLHTFRHFFASYCAQQNLSYKYVLEWMGHSSSAILDMYFTMNDRHAQAAMNSLSFDSEQGQSRTVVGQSGGHSAQTLPQVSHV